jgi:cellulose synthase operon protein YhjQ
MDLDETGGKLAVAGTPDDVAALYLWANLHGAKYRDFSASRREYRAQVRYRAAQILHMRELQAQAEAEAAAATAECAVLAAEAVEAAQSTGDSQVLHLQALRSAESAARVAAAERVEAARRAEAAAEAGMLAERERREIAEAHASAQRQARSYTESELRQRKLASAQPGGPLPGELGDPYTPLNGAANGSSNGQNGDLNGALGVAAADQDGSGERDGSGRSDSSRRASSSSTLNLYSPPRERSGLPEPDRVTTSRAGDGLAAGDPERIGSPSNLQAESDSDSKANSDSSSNFASNAESTWLSAPHSQPPTLPAPQVKGGDTLQDSRERVASRWFALQGAFEPRTPELPATRPMRPGDTRTPVLLVFSLAGGVGKTSLVATLGRALSSQGERVVLTDTTSHGLLPYYFGARELRPGVVRSFSPPAGSDDAPISLVSYDLQSKPEDEAQQELLALEIVRNGSGNHRVLLDVATVSSWLIRRMADLRTTVLVPMAPDMNSVIGMQAVERFFQGVTGADGRPLLPFYVLNQFDSGLPLHLDVREVFRRQLGDRLLRFPVRRSPAVGEALAEGMTVVDYAPAAPVSKDYLEVASWLRGVSPPVSSEAPLDPVLGFQAVSPTVAAGSSDGRWGER